jgi:hypothetical protein
MAPPLISTPSPPPNPAWAVAETSAFWSPATGRSVSHTWSLGRTPFGPLSTSSELSWAQRDAAKRNLVLAALNASVGHAAALLEGVVRVAGPDARVGAVLAAEQVGGGVGGWGGLFEGRGWGRAGRRQGGGVCPCAGRVFVGALGRAACGWVGSGCLPPEGPGIDRPPHPPRRPPPRPATPRRA